MQTEYDANFLEYWKLPNRIYTVKINKNNGNDDDCDVKNTLPAHIGAFFFSSTIRRVNHYD